MEFIGNRSILIVVLTGTFTGMALSFQVYLGFRLVSATNLTGPIVAMGIVRELGPVLTGFDRVCKGRWSHCRQSGFHESE